MDEPSALAHIQARYEADVQAFRDRELSLRDASALLERVAGKTRHEVMVPLGPLALVPGYLRHTNEVLCLLGDNYFAERSAGQVREILGRRLERVRAVRQEAELKLRVLRGSAGDLGSEAVVTSPQTHIVYGDDGEELVEIRQPLEEVEEAVVREEWVEQAAPAAAPATPAAPATTGVGVGVGVDANVDVAPAAFDSFWDELGSDETTTAESPLAPPSGKATAFTGQIVVNDDDDDDGDDRDGDDRDGGHSCGGKPMPCAKPEPKPTSAKKRVSRFKARRQGLEQ